MINKSTYSKLAKKLYTDKLIDKASKNKAKLLYFSNPNNPMGTWMRGDKIVSLLEKLPDDCLLIF